MVDGLFEFIGAVTINCLVLFVVAGIILGTSWLISFSRGWLIWGPTHQERLAGMEARLNETERTLSHTREELVWFRTKAFTLAGLADVATEPNHD